MEPIRNLRGFSSSEYCKPSKHTDQPSLLTNDEKLEVQAALHPMTSTAAARHSLYDPHDLALLFRAVMTSLPPLACNAALVGIGGGDSAQCLLALSLALVDGCIVPQPHALDNQ